MEFEQNKVIFSAEGYQELVGLLKTTHEYNIRLREDSARLREDNKRLESKVDTLTNMVEKLVVDKMENSGVNP